jgi:hypothetical protein
MRNMEQAIIPDTDYNKKTKKSIMIRIITMTMKITTIAIMYETIK